MAADPPLRLALLLGDPVAHSLSPLIHNAAFRAAGIPAVYRAARTPARVLEAAVGGLRRPEVLGANLTIPHKEAALRMVDELDPQAAALGALNTIVRRRDATLRGYNTDVAGFLGPLDVASVHRGSILVLGSGGAARAVIFALLTHAAPTRLTIAARTPPRAEAIARELEPLAGGGLLDVIALDKAPAAAQAAGLIVNTTPVGMHPDVDATPLPGAVFVEEQTIYDLVYEPRDTLLLREARECGARVIGGLEMLLGQAAEAFRLWTGTEMPRVAVDEALRTA